MITKSSSPNLVDERTALLLRIVTGWQAVLAFLALALVIVAWLTPTLALWLRILFTLLLLPLAGLSVSAIRPLQRRQHRGRVLGLVVNYLGFLVCLLYGLHLTGIYLAIDALAASFGKGIIFLAGVFGGYLVTTLADRYDNFPQKQQFFRRAGGWVMAFFAALFLLAVGILPGLGWFLLQLFKPLALAMFFGVAVFSFMLWALWRHPSAEALGAKNSHAEMLSGFLFLSPNLLGFVLFFAGPLLFSLYTSFTDWDAFSQPNFIGLANYAEIFNLNIVRLDTPTQPYQDVLDAGVYSELTRINLFGQSYVVGAEDKLFWLALRNTALFSLLAVPLSVIPALLLANLLNSKLPGMKFFRAVYFLPSIAAVVGVALIWQWLYNASVGYINYAISQAINLINLIPGLALELEPTRWLSDTRTALLAVVIMSAWQWIGFNTVLFLAGLQNVPGELYEAATVDGAGKWAKFWYVTLPLLAPTTFFVVTTAVIQALQLFEQVYVLIPTEPPGGPNNATLSLVLYLYQKGFQRFDQGYASAVAWVLFIAIFTITLIQNRRQQANS